jgi:predicted SAM-dependent methyltransferase
LKWGAGPTGPASDKKRSEMRELIIGCGNKKVEKAVQIDGDSKYKNPVTLDIDPDCHPDVLWDLEKLPLPFKDNEFDEIHAYEILEHTGQQGDYKFFFAQFTDFWRILKPGGLFCATVPNWDNIAAWGDPSHKRIINEMTLMFLIQKEYEKQIGVTSMADYRRLYKSDFKVILMEKTKYRLAFALEAIKENIDEQGS